MVARTKPVGQRDSPGPATKNSVSSSSKCKVSQNLMEAPRTGAAVLSLSFGFSFADLYDREGLVRLDARFLQELGEANSTLRDRLELARQDQATASGKAYSELMIEVAPYLEDFIGKLFGVERELAALQQRHHELAPLYAVKRKFVQRKALTGYTEERASEVDGFAIRAELQNLFQEPFTEFSFALHVARWMEDEATHAPQLQLAAA
jgi:hypothetical protein